MIEKTGQPENVHGDLGEIILYQSEDGRAALDVRLQDETVGSARNRYRPFLKRKEV